MYIIKVISRCSSFEVFTAVYSTIPVFWDVKLRRCMDDSRIFEGRDREPFTIKGCISLWRRRESRSYAVHIPEDRNPRLSVNKHQASKLFERVETQLRALLTSAQQLGGCKWSASCSTGLTPAVDSHWYPLNERLGGPQCRCQSFGVEKCLLLLPGN